MYKATQYLSLLMFYLKEKLVLSINKRRTTCIKAKWAAIRMAETLEMQERKSILL